MAINIRMRGKAKGGVAEVKALIKHEMESGARMNKKTGKPYPAKFINTVKVTVNGVEAVNSEWSGAVSANPYMAIMLNANTGDEVKISLTDNTGDTGEETLKV